MINGRSHPSTSVSMSIGARSVDQPTDSLCTLGDLSCQQKGVDAVRRTSPSPVSMGFSRAGGLIVPNTNSNSMLRVSKHFLIAMMSTPPRRRTTQRFTRISSYSMSPRRTEPYEGAHPTDSVRNCPLPKVQVGSSPNPGTAAKVRLEERSRRGSSTVSMVSGDSEGLGRPCETNCRSPSTAARRGTNQSCKPWAPCRFRRKIRHSP